MQNYDISDVKDGFCATGQFAYPFRTTYESDPSWI